MEKIHSAQWNKLASGDSVRVKGQRGQFTFIRHVSVKETGEEWIDVYGGANGHMMFRSFVPDLVKPQVRRRKSEL